MVCKACLIKAMVKNLCSLSLLERLVREDNICCNDDLFDHVTTSKEERMKHKLVLLDMIELHVKLSRRLLPQQ